MGVYLSHSAADTRTIGRRLAEELRGGGLVLFTGGLGAGKTAFCGGIAEGLGCTDPVSSPTFSIVNVYRGPVTFAHFDMYRIQSEEDLYACSFYDYLDAGAAVAVEWSENIAAYLDEPCIRVEIENLGGDERKITVTGAKNL
ncbi:MAG TPA: tRNA (adenosine(37)-N6)-threonylcarbamoyltransferase complex ATPase subunit type 1 TsaE [Candidatus Pygmaiobacter gallistercoris]|nr:tRNA (adenosine(37)-N6)-threonylcarbamoyltransferase complex ATPase subunit type 1 TsaE [Candidatus Pygmaiobacter gallistercoris]